jgi:hypothetical protein
MVANLLDLFPEESSIPASFVSPKSMVFVRGCWLNSVAQHLSALLTATPPPCSYLFPSLPRQKRGGWWSMDALAPIFFLSVPVLVAAVVLGVRDYLREGRNRRAQTHSEPRTGNFGA